MPVPEANPIPRFEAVLEEELGELKIRLLQAYGYQFGNNGDWREGAVYAMGQAASNDRLNGIAARAQLRSSNASLQLGQQASLQSFVWGRGSINSQGGQQSRVSVDRACDVIPRRPPLVSQAAPRQFSNDGPSTPLVGPATPLTDPKTMSLFTPQALPRLVEQVLITPRIGPRIEAGHVEAFVRADNDGWDCDSDTDETAGIGIRRGSTTSSLREPLQRWAHLVISLTRPKTRLAMCKTTYAMHEVWQSYWGMLRHNDASCQQVFAAAMAKVLRGRHGNLRCDSVQSKISKLMGVSSKTLAQKCFVHPDSLLRQVWILLSFCFMLCDIAVVPAKAFFEAGDSDLYASYLWVVAVFWLLDIVMSFFSGRYVRGLLDMRPGFIVHTYLKTWFLFDLSLFVLDVLIASIESAESEHSIFVLMGHATNGSRFLHLFRLVRLRRLYLILGEMLSVSSKGMIVLTGMMKTLLLYVTYCHFWACCWYGIGRIHYDGWGSMCKRDSSTLWHCYFQAVQWAVTQPVGSTSIGFTTTIEWCFSTLSLLFSALFIAVCLGKIFEAVVYFTGADKLEMRKRCVSCAKHRNLPLELARRVIEYIETSELEVDLAALLTHESDVLQLLPSALQGEILEESRKPRLSCIRIVTDLEHVSRKVTRELCAEATTSQLHSRGDQVFSAGDACSFWRIVDYGKLMYVIGMDSWTDVASSLFHESGDASVTQVHAGGSCKSVGDQNVQARNSFGRNSRQGSADSTCTWGNMTGKLAGAAQPIQDGQSISEMVLWTPWTHTGDLITTSDVAMLHLSVEAFFNVVKARMDTCLLASKYAFQVVKYMCSLQSGISDLHEFAVKDDFVDETGGNSHLIFLSHYKAEAGTEATLMMEALKMLIARECGEFEDSGVFLDSEDLTDLATLRDHVINSQNLLLLLTPGVLLRPWCLVEIVTAMDNGVQIVPVEIQRPGLKFAFPDEEFYEDLRDNQLLSGQDMNLLFSEGITTDIIEAALRVVFLQIALPFSPHKSKGIREAELLDIMQRCNLVREGSPTSNKGVTKARTTVSDDRRFFGEMSKSFSSR